MFGCGRVIVESKSLLWRVLLEDGHSEHCRPSYNLGILSHRGRLKSLFRLIKWGFLF